MSRPDANQIEQEIAALRSLKPSIRQFSEMADDNHAALDAQVRVLEQRMTFKEILETWPPAQDEDDDPGADHQNCYAILALGWREGELDEPPSSDWMTLL